MTIHAWEPLLVIASLAYFWLTIHYDRPRHKNPAKHCCLFDYALFQFLHIVLRLLWRMATKQWLLLLVLGGSIFMDNVVTSQLKALHHNIVHWPASMLRSIWARPSRWWVAKLQESLGNLWHFDCGILQKPKNTSYNILYIVKKFKIHYNIVLQRWHHKLSLYNA